MEASESLRNSHRCVAESTELNTSLREVIPLRCLLRCDCMRGQLNMMCSFVWSTWHGGSGEQVDQGLPLPVWGGIVQLGVGSSGGLMATMGLGGSRSEQGYVNIITWSSAPCARVSHKHVSVLSIVGQKCME